MTLDGFVKGIQTERDVAPQRVERAKDAADAVEGFMDTVWTTKVRELTARTFGLRVHNGFQTPFVKLKDGNEAAIRRMATIGHKEYQLVAKTEDTTDPDYEGETYAQVPVKAGGAPRNAAIEYAPGVDVSDITVALEHDDEVVGTFNEIVDALQQEYPELQAEQPVTTS